MFEQKQRPAVLEFLSGFFAGIGIILLTLLLTILLGFMLDASTPLFRSGGSHFAAVLWAVLALGIGALVFRHRGQQHRQSSFTAGLVTAAAVFFLLDAACWSFTL